MVTYILLTGAPPFGGGTDAEINAACAAGTVPTDAWLWGGISADARAADGASHHGFVQCGRGRQRSAAGRGHQRSVARWED